MSENPALRKLADEKAALVQLKKDLEHPAGKRLVDRLKMQMALLQSQYITLDATTHPNVVVSNLAKKQGKEEQCRELIAAYTDVEAQIKRLDEKLEK